MTDELELELAGLRVSEHDPPWPGEAPTMVGLGVVVAFTRCESAGVYAVCIGTEDGVVSFDVPIRNVRALSNPAAAIDYRRAAAALGIEIDDE